MPEYIEREAAIKELMNDAHEQVGYSREDAADCIRYMDADDVAPVRHGRWEEASDGDGIVCPFCRTDFCTIIYDTEHFNYCPNCGAKMDETVEESKP